METAESLTKSKRRRLNRKARLLTESEGSVETKKRPAVEKETASSSSSISKKQRKTLNGNELLEYFIAMNKKHPNLKRAFDSKLDDSTRKEATDQFERCMDAVEKYGWGIPDERALNIVAAFAPIVEIGAGRGYWCRLLRDRNVVIHSFDSHLPNASDRLQNWTDVKRGGPETLNQFDKSHTLFLCYPDEDSSMANNCLQHFKGNVVIHVGELFGHTANIDNPWGRTSSEDFQSRLVGEYHCILKVPLPSWPCSFDCLTVWKKTRYVEFGDMGMAYVPSGERLDVTAAAPCCAHLLQS